MFEQAFGLTLRPEIAALPMSGSSLIVAVNALALKTVPPANPPPQAVASRDASTAHSHDAEHHPA